MNCLRLAICVISALAVCSADDAPAFEVASLKPSGPIDPLRARLLERMADDVPRGTPGQGQRVEMRGFTAAQLIAAAYKIPAREIEGPSWMNDVRFEVDAIIPAGQSRDKAPEMLQTLLQERLGLKAHRDVHRMSGYLLTIAKGGPKLPEAPPFVPNAGMGDLANRPRPLPGFSARLGHADMAQLANMLAHELNAPVEDRTGLKGFYVISIHIEPGDMKDESQRPAAFQDAMSAYGLHLASGKIDAPVLVIDNISKTPVEN